MDELTYEEAEKIALHAIHDTNGRGMIGPNRRHLHQRVARAILAARKEALAKADAIISGGEDMSSGGRLPCAQEHTPTPSPAGLTEPFTVSARSYTQAEVDAILKAAYPSVGDGPRKTESAALFAEACEHVRHAPDCGHHGRGDAFCTCGAVDFLGRLEIALEAR
jgi:hypothetical protein